jgi:lysozyme
MLHGVDVAFWQGDPGQWHDAAGDIDWAAVKVTELEPGNARYVDADAAADWAWLKTAEKKRVAYLFGHASVPAAESVDFFAEVLAELGLEDDDAVGLDIEPDGADGRGPDEVAAWAREVLGLLAERFSRDPLVYSDIAFILEGNLAGCEDHPLWLADPSQPEGKPVTPAPFKRVTIQQYDITGPIDRDVAFFDTADDMTKALGKRPATPAPAPVPKPKPADPVAKPTPDPLQFVSQADLVAVQHFPPTADAFALRWSRIKREVSWLAGDGGVVRADVDGPVESTVSIRFVAPGSAQVAIVRVAADAQPLASPAVFDGAGEWATFTIPFTAAKGADYRVDLTNLSGRTLTAVEGTWEIVA